VYRYLGRVAMFWISHPVTQLESPATEKRETEDPGGRCHCGTCVVVRIYMYLPLLRHLLLLCTIPPSSNRIAATLGTESRVFKLAKAQSDGFMKYYMRGECYLCDEVVVGF
jgi:hypothetical protein